MTAWILFFVFLFLMTVLVGILIEDYFDYR